MKLRDLCKGLEYTLIQGNMDISIGNIAYDSRKISEGDMFVCMTGAVTDGHKYIPQAIEGGAAVIVLENPETGFVIPSCVTVIKVDSARRALAKISAAYFHYPAERLLTIGVTGTKGKTTTAYMIKTIMEKAGIKTGIMGTISVNTGKRELPSSNTTPESYDIHGYMSEMIEDGCSCVVMEVSSQGLKLDRTAGISFDMGVFTNISPDHIGPGEHENFQEYIACKSLLFRQCKEGVVNLDDTHVEQILEGHTCRVTTFSTEKNADMTASHVDFLNQKGSLGTEFSLSGLLECRAQIRMPGMFAVYNALAAATVCSRLGIDREHILEGLKDVHVKGRVEMVKVSDDFGIIIDYAHNDVSVRSVLNALRDYEPSRVTVVMGCGGNRSAVRRYDMGKAVGELADLCILTCDNPRFEEISSINADIKTGLDEVKGSYIEIDNRREAIAYGITHAQKGEMLVLIGKGHEDYIEIQGVKHHFSEHEAVKSIISEIREGRKSFENPVTLLEEDLNNS